MITLITPTGDRPEAFKLLEGYVRRQTHPYDEWIVVDDGAVPTKMNMHQTYFLRPSTEGMTLQANLLYALQWVKGTTVIILEDDDWYSPAYIGLMKRLLHTADLVGEIPSLYYHIVTGYHAWMMNRSHASLCQTAFRNVPQVIDILKTVLCLPNPHVDMNLWIMFKGKKILFENQNNLHCVGIKGMPGRHGFGIGHSKDHPMWLQGRDSEKLLRRYMKGDADNYLK